MCVLYEWKPNERELKNHLTCAVLCTRASTEDVKGCSGYAEVLLIVVSIQRYIRTFILMEVNCCEWLLFTWHVWFDLDTRARWENLCYNSPHSSIICTGRTHSKLALFRVFNFKVEILRITKVKKTIPVNPKIEYFLSFFSFFFLLSLSLSICTCRVECQLKFWRNFGRSLVCTDHRLRLWCPDQITRLNVNAVNGLMHDFAWKHRLLDLIYWLVLGNLAKMSVNLKGSQLNQ